MILPAQTIRTLRPISPLIDRTVCRGVTGGLGPAGYDIHLDQDAWLWPGRFLLASASERFAMPADVLGVVHDKSTWARRGVALQNTVIEPGWSGYLTLEITMHAWRFLRIQRGTPIAQVLFHRLEAATDRPYRGRYQNQARGPQPATEAGRAALREREG